ncbi:hypothetical protein V6Z11_A11G213300 [Gossypium hirsutum]
MDSKILIEILSPFPHHTCIVFSTFKDKIIHVVPTILEQPSIPSHATRPPASQCSESSSPQSADCQGPRESEWHEPRGSLLVHEQEFPPWPHTLDTSSQNFSE